MMKRSMVVLVSAGASAIACANAMSGADEPALCVAGPEAHAWFGSAVDWEPGAHASRFIVGAPVSDAESGNRPGEAFVHEATSSKLVWQFVGEANGDKFGAAVALIGDITGDGHSEALIGAPGNDAGGTDAGRAYVFAGATGELLEVFTGDQADDWFGFSVAGVGDVNGDGVPDFAIGARRPSGTGYVRIYCGATFKMLHLLADAQEQTHFGFAIANTVLGNGDVNGDGFDDVAVGAPFHPAPGFFGGRVYVYSGNDGSLLHTFDGEGGFNFFGTSVAIAGDVNGDGRADVLIGADGNSAGGTNAGRAYVFSGSDGSLLHVFTGEEERGRLGRGVSAIGDVNGDGHADLVVGQPAPLAVGGSGIGRVFIFSGSSGEVLHEFTARLIDQFFGFAVAGVNGRHLLVGAFASDVNGMQSGTACVYDVSECAEADLNCDGVVDGADLLLLLSQWGACAKCDDCQADLDGNCVVDGADLLILLSNWG